MTANEMLFHDIAAALSSTNIATGESKLFGKPAVQSGGKAFLCFFQDAMVFKLSGDAHSEAMDLPGAKLFDPSGAKRPMKEWVQLGGEHKKHWIRFAGLAHGFAALAATSEKKPAPAKKEKSPAKKKAAPKKAVVKKKSARPAGKAVAKKPVAKKSTAKKSAVKKPAVKKSAVKKKTVTKKK